jgi:hypothetical protein
VQDVRDAWREAVKCTLWLVGSTLGEWVGRLARRWVAFQAGVEAELERGANTNQAD